MGADRRIVIFGPPGAGKGTQSRKLARRFGITHISTGRILRDAVRANSVIGIKVNRFLVRGLLVPDELVRSVAERAITEAGVDNFLLDGYPRTIRQAEWLKEFLSEHHCQLSAVLSLKLSESDIIARLSRRRVYPATGENFHLDHKPPPEDIRTKLVRRLDDTPDAIRKRLQVYRKDTAPVARFYEQAGLLVRIDAAGTFETVHGRVCGALQLT
ncbi:MAG: adenylate kinase [Bacteroidota bacterium]|nr:adenylate kinase [Bacteroidota bacterium]